MSDIDTKIKFSERIITFKYTYITFLFQFTRPLKMTMKILCVLFKKMRRIGFIFVVLFGVSLANENAKCGPFTVPDLRSSGYALVKEGDINLAGMFPIGQSYRAAGRCGDSISYYWVVTAEIMISAIEMINKQRHLLGNVTLGYVILDECGQQSVATARALHLIPANPGHGTNVTRCDPGSQYPFYDVVGIVGAMYSSISMSIATVSTMFHLPQISALSTNDELSDKSRYPYFMRVIPADTYQSRAIVHLIEHFNWTYISTINTEGPYGSGAIKQIHKLAKEAEVCVAYSREISSQTTDEEYKEISQRLRKNGKARVIVAFVSPTHIARLLAALDELNAHGEFIWIFGESYSVARTTTVTYEKVLRGSFFLELHSNPVPDHLMRGSFLDPMTKPHNHWLRDYWQNFYKCTWDVLATDNKTLCSTLPNPPVRSTNFVVAFVLDSVYAFAHGLKSLITSECQRQRYDKYALRRCIKGRALRDHIRNVSFQGYHGVVRFDSKGDGYGTYNIIQLHGGNGQDGRQRYRHVASWSTGDANLDINSSLLQWTNKDKWGNLVRSRVIPESLCSRPCLPGEFLIPQELKCCWECRRCRNNEVITNNATRCTQCPLFMWPNQATFLTCENIAPYFMKWEHTAAVLLIGTSIVGIVGTSFIAGVFLKFQDNRLIKATGRELNLVTFVGTYIAFWTVFMFVSRPSPNTCQLSRFGFNTAFTIEYSAMLAKVNRIYRIFHAGKRGTKRPAFISAQAQMVICSALIAVQVKQLGIPIAPVTPDSKRRTNSKLAGRTR